MQFGKNGSKKRPFTGRFRGFRKTDDGKSGHFSNSKKKTEQDWSHGTEYEYCTVMDTIFMDRYGAIHIGLNNEQLAVSWNIPSQLMGCVRPLPIGIVSNILYRQYTTEL